jgi:hypothetical protein
MHREAAISCTRRRAEDLAAAEDSRIVREPHEADTVVLGVGDGQTSPRIERQIRRLLKLRITAGPVPVSRVGIAVEGFRVRYAAGQPQRLAGREIDAPHSRPTRLGQI